MYVDDISFSEIITKDKTPYSNHGTIFGATFSTDKLGHANKSMSFDGVNDYINIPNSAF
jgi:hypothetical protein